MARLADGYVHSRVTNVDPNGRSERPLPQSGSPEKFLHPRYSESRGRAQVHNLRRRYGDATPRLGGALPRIGGRLRGQGFEELLLAIDQRIDVVGGELESMTVRDGIGGTSFDAVATEYAAGIIDIVDAGVAFTGGDAPRFGILGGFDIDTARWTGRGAQKTADAFLQSVFIALQNVDAAIASLEVHGLVRIILRGALSPKIAKGNAEAFRESRYGAANFFEDRSHCM